jgi:hypothetical protein
MSPRLWGCACLAGVAATIVTLPANAWADSEADASAEPGDAEVTTEQENVGPADAPTLPATPPPPPKIAAPSTTAEASHWYGWQTLITDGASILTIPLIIGLPSWFLATPIVHFSHGRVGAGFGSLGIRIASVVLFAVGALAITGGEAGDSGVNQAAAGSLVLAIFAVPMTVDAAILAYEPVPERTGAAPPPHRLGAIVPLVLPRREGGLDLGVRASF